MKIIALLTDFGLKDNYVGLMKGVILKINPQVNIVDITHGIGRHNIREAAFLLRASFPYFSPGTIFVAVVDPGVGSERRPIAIQTDNYYFLGPDNGVLSLAGKKDRIKAAVALENKKYFLENVSSTFHGRDIFASCAAHLARGVSFFSLGEQIERIGELEISPPQVKNDKIIGEIIYCDAFGNLITNITLQQLLAYAGEGGFIATLKGKTITRVYSFYAQADSEEPFFIEGSFGYLEISLNQRGAKEYFSLESGESPEITIERRPSRGGSIS